MEEYIKPPYKVVVVAACVDGVEPVFVNAGLFVFIRQLPPIVIPFVTDDKIVEPIVKAFAVVVESNVSVFNV